MAQQGSNAAQQEGPKVYSGGSGASQEDAVVITAPSPHLGISAEYAYVESKCGRRGRDWTLLEQALLLGPAGKRYDCLSVRLADGATRDFFFDITSFYGRH
jgi:hypothetical protein